MVRTFILAILAAVVLGGCMTSGYGYRGGRGDYYYGQPTIEYRHYGAPYYGGSLGYGYYDYGYGYPYWYSGHPYGYYDPGYYYVAPPQYPPTQPPQQDPDRSDLSAKAWAEMHGYPLNSQVTGSPAESHPFDADSRRPQMATPDPRMRASNPVLPASRARAPSSSGTPARAPSQRAPSQRPIRTYTPSRPQSSSQQSRSLPARASSNADEDIRLRMRRQP